MVDFNLHFYLYRQRGTANQEHQRLLHVQPLLKRVSIAVREAQAQLCVPAGHKDYAARGQDQHGK